MVDRRPSHGAGVTDRDERWHRFTAGHARPGLLVAVGLSVQRVERTHVRGVDDDHALAGIDDRGEWTRVGLEPDGAILIRVEFRMTLDGALALVDHDIT